MTELAPLILAPSLLAADFSKIKEELDIIAKSPAPYIHLDVMDGHFVPNITIGPPVIASARKISRLVFDTHLMIENPGKYIEAFAKAGADIINFHLEAVTEQEVLPLIKDIRALGKKPALTIKPKTPPEALFPYLSQIDMALVMSVEPGFGGQSFMNDSLNKIKTLSDYITKHGLQTHIEVDGGITHDNVSDVLRAGANVIVAGSSVFRGNISENIEGFYSLFNS